MSRPVVAVVGLILLLLLTVVDETSAVFVISEEEQAIVTQFGDYRRQVTKPGLYFKIPFAQTVHRMERRIVASDTLGDDFLTLDKKKLVADPVVRWRIVDPRVFYITVRNPVQARRALDDIVKGELREAISNQNFGNIIGNAREPLMAEVTKRVQEKATEYGVDVVDVRIKRADLPTQVQESVFERMRAERERESKRYRSEGEEEAAKIRADTDKLVTIELAKAYEKAERLRGEGDALSAQIYAEAFGKDPEFYSFVRSLETYEQALDAETELVLSTDNELFRYFSEPARGRR